MPDQAGRVHLVTGANTGLAQGYELTLGVNCVGTFSLRSCSPRCSRPRPSAAQLLSPQRRARHLAVVVRPRQERRQSARSERPLLRQQDRRLGAGRRVCAPPPPGQHCQRAHQPGQPNVRAVARHGLHLSHADVAAVLPGGQWCVHGAVCDAVNSMSPWPRVAAGSSLLVASTRSRARWCQRRSSRARAARAAVPSSGSGLRTRSRSICRQARGSERERREGR